MSLEMLQLPNMPDTVGDQVYQSFLMIKDIYRDVTGSVMDSGRLVRGLRHDEDIHGSATRGKPDVAIQRMLLSRRKAVNGKVE